VSLKVHAGEIVGLSGLVGSGRTEVARAIFGVDALTSGEVFINGYAFSGSPFEARKLGVGLIPESRKTQGLALMRTVGDNLLVSALRKVFPSGYYSASRGRSFSQKLIDRLRIATPSPRTMAQSLSGGNQQKIVIGKWLMAHARLFIFDEPTRAERKS
jgi:ribose transport system ATP-binding protein